LLKQKEKLKTGTESYKQYSSNQKHREELNIHYFPMLANVYLSKLSLPHIF